MPPHEAEALRFLVHKHMLMNHLAFRRDTADEQLAVQFAVQVGSPEVLQMLYVLTAADLGAVGPDVWDGWKAEVVTDLYIARCSTWPARARDHDRRAAGRAAARGGRRVLGPRAGRSRGSPSRSTPCRPAISTPRRPSRRPPICGCCTACGRGGGARPPAQYQPETDTVQFTVATSERRRAGHLPQADRRR